MKRVVSVYPVKHIQYFWVILWHSKVAWERMLYQQQVRYFREKTMAPHSSTVAWKIPWMEKPGRLQSMGSHRVGHDWSDLAAADTLNIQKIINLKEHIYWNNTRRNWYIDKCKSNPTFWFQQKKRRKTVMSL